uniref:SFRICE_000010 n=1 Tax=Spodoptera frugiperda TaxID=7108 RepID=A0A2H1VGU1_SPOFR
MPAKYDPNTLWVALSQYSDGNVFEVYPKLLAQLFLQEEAARQDGDTSEAEKLVLPSDKDYRLQKYFVLVELQKELEEDENGDIVSKPVEDSVEEWAPWSLVVATKNPHAPPPVAVKTSPGPAWDIGQVLKAARLLCKPPLPVDFIDEQEMRCVYSLIYEVFRYKSILDQALEDVAFLVEHREFIEHRHALWLFLMELARRRWGARSRSENERATQLLEEAGYPFKNIENIIWNERVHLAAAIARIRIKNRAFSLADLLPPHLREERVSACVNKDSVTGWVNTFKAKLVPLPNMTLKLRPIRKVALLVKRLHELGYTYSNSRQLCAGEYRFDRVCPRFITLRPPENDSIGQLDLVRDGVIVLQVVKTSSYFISTGNWKPVYEREFCEGASTLCRALRANCLRGVVAQTHASSPRCSAYLAAQLRELAAVFKAKAPAAPATPELGKLVVFGAGDKVESYVCALRELGIEASQAPQSGAPVCVISDPVHYDTPVVTNALDGVVAVLATPPNSYSAVTDPIDLVCGRGGDLAMLEILTESEVDVEGKARVQSILEEQKRTLKSLMSKPQIQLILYETHSALEAENQAQITRAVAEANRLARERHALLKRKHRQPSPQKQALSVVNETVVVDGNAANVLEASESVSSLGSASNSDIEKDENEDEEMSVCECSPTRSASGSRPSTAKIKSSTTTLKKQAENLEVQSCPATNKARPIPAMPSYDIPKDPDKDSPDVIVPSCDLFEIRTLPNLGNGLDINYILDRDGCFLGLIQRKEITRLDAKFMIRVAEDRGLFGPGAGAPQPQRRKRTETAALSPRRRRRKASFEVDRVAAPTYASMSRAARRGSAPGCLDTTCTGTADRHVCERHARRQAAAAAITSAACHCDARHKHRRSSAAGVTGTSAASGSRQPEAPCRRPFPLVVHELQLQAVVQHHKIFAS